MRSWKQMSGGLKVALAATVVLALAIVWVLVDERLGAGEKPNDSVKASAKEGPDRDDAKPAGKPLELGTAAKISANYRVAVTELDLYNAPAGRVMAVTVRARYIGKEDGEPWADLTVEYAGKGSGSYGEATCPFDLGDKDGSDQATLGPDDETTYGVCLELPSGEIEGGRVFVEEAFSDRPGTSWSVEGAVTKTLPAPAPRSTAQRAPANQPQRQSDNDDNSDVGDSCEKYEDDVEEYKENIGKLDKLAEQADEDDKDEYEEWKDSMDANIERYEKYC